MDLPPLLAERLVLATSTARELSGTVGEVLGEPYLPLGLIDRGNVLQRCHLFHRCRGGSLRDDESTSQAGTPAAPSLPPRFSVDVRPCGCTISPVRRLRRIYPALAPHLGAIGAGRGPAPASATVRPCNACCRCATNNRLTTPSSSSAVACSAPRAWSERRHVRSGCLACSGSRSRPRSG